MFIKYALSFGISLAATLCVMPILIPFLHKIKFGQSIRKEGPQSHMKKTGTPTMGGIVFVIVPLLIMAILDHQAFFSLDVLIVMLAYLGYALIGFIDDYLIVVQKKNDGLKPAVKFAMQSVLAVLFYFIYQGMASTAIDLPFIKEPLELGIFYFALVFIMFTAESNAVNLTDGLDGLCAGCSVIAIAPYIVFALVQKNSDLALLLLAVAGALLGYLKFNLHPAKIFMGDTGSLALGGLLAASAMVLKKELLLLIIGAVFLIETLSVVIQVTSYKLTRKRVFKMAPIHHHFELSGFKETQVVLLFWSFGLICAVIGCWFGVM
ncbi:phospho-N-acetylmuramoyl-pentapeptide-transferase [Massilicoli timonensis]|uniref:phospho-N-acetylmuramoyl-pentapeptide- transferase n=1 Tax=Massilicoli timonensis TaxID=2015901 RepID=UPI000C82741C|nr:phospho-N-acetylmuramoyl-pentapeptide-transferase [Massilicoli timonensis]